MWNRRTAIVPPSIVTILKVARISLVRFISYCWYILYIHIKMTNHVDTWNPKCPEKKSVRCPSICTYSGFLKSQYNPKMTGPLNRVIIIHHIHNWSQSNIQLDKTVTKLHLFNTAATASEPPNSIKKEENNNKISRLKKETSVWFNGDISINTIKIWTSTAIKKHTLTKGITGKKLKKI